MQDLFPVRVIVRSIFVCGELAQAGLCSRGVDGCSLRYCITTFEKFVSQLLFSKVLCYFHIMRR